MKYFWLLLLCCFAGAQFAHGQSLHDGITSKIQNYEVVLLGDQTHREGNVILHKIELIKALHTGKNFDLLLIEDDFYKVYKLSRLSSDSFMHNYRDYLMPIHSDSQEFVGLMNYLSHANAADKPLFFAGFDAQVIAEDHRELIEDLQHFLTGQQQSITVAETDFLNGQCELVVDPHQKWPDSEQQKNRVNKLLLQLQSKLEAMKTPEAQIWEQVVRLMRGSFHAKELSSSGRLTDASNVRDSLMASNFIFWKNYYKGKKIVAWGASYHFADKVNALVASPVTDSLAKQLGQVSTKALYNELFRGRPMGYWLKRNFPGKVVSLAFTNGSGNYGAGYELAMPIVPPPPNSYENRFGKPIDELQWISTESNDSLFSSALGHLPLKGRWSQLFDGFLYTPKSRPLSPLQLSTIGNQSKSLKIKGRLLDLSGDPVSFANIRSSSGKSAVSNGNGYFELSKTKGADTIFISSIGFKQKLLPLAGDSTDTNVVITLETAAQLLAEVRITPKRYPSASAIIKGVHQNLLMNYAEDPFCMEIFTRKTTQGKDSIVRKVENVIDFYAPYGYSREYSFQTYGRNHFANIKHSRAIGSDKPRQPAILGLMDLDIVARYAPILQRSKINSFSFKLVGTNYLNDHLVYILAFEQKINGASRSNNWVASYSGKLYVNAADYAVLKYEAEILRLPDPAEAEPDVTPKMVIKLLSSYEKIGFVYRFKAGRTMIESNFSTAKDIKTNEEYMRTSICKESKPELAGDLFNGMKPVEYDADFWKNFPVMVEVDQ